MPRFHGHPNDGQKRHDYIQRKIDHMRRQGLITGRNSGLGNSGGACPDWLKEMQDKGQKQ